MWSSSCSKPVVVGVALVVINLLIYAVLTSLPLPPRIRGSNGRECVNPTFSASSAAGRANYFDTPLALSSLRETSRDKWIHLVGDSTVRETFYEFVSLMKRQPLGVKPTPQELDRRYKLRHQSQTVRIGSSRVSFTWRPFCADVVEEWKMWKQKEQKVLSAVTSASSSTPSSLPSVVMMSCGLWDLLYSNNTTIDATMLSMWQTFNDRSFSSRSHSTPQARGIEFLFKTSSPITDARLTGHRMAAAQFRDANLVALSQRIVEAVTDSRRITLDLRPWTIPVADGHALVLDSTTITASAAGPEDELNNPASPSTTSLLSSSVSSPAAATPCEDTFDGLHSPRASILAAHSLAAFSYCVIGGAPFELTAPQLVLLVLGCVMLGWWAYEQVMEALKRCGLVNTPMRCYSSNGGSNTSGSGGGYSVISIRSSALESADETGGGLGVELGLRRTHPNTATSSSSSSTSSSSPNTTTSNNDALLSTLSNDGSSSSSHLHQHLSPGNNHLALDDSQSSEETKLLMQTSSSSSSSSSSSAAASSPSPSSPSTAPPRSSPSSSPSASSLSLSKSSSSSSASSSSSLVPVLFAFLQLAFVLLLVYFMDGDHRLSWRLIADKTYVRDSFFFVCFVIALLSCFTVRTSSVSEVLHRDQTEEWKGWMQILFVLYHYFSAKEMYNLIRIFIAAYVWLTGYGNFLFFAKQKDYSLTRLMKMLFRLNFFVVFICVAMDREYMQYYVCALHTTFFLLVYIVMYIKSEYNSNPYFMFSKFAVCFVVLLLLYDFDNSTGLFEAMFGWNRLFLLNNSLHEWKFRSTLDHFATLCGMVFAWQVHRFQAFLHHIETECTALRRTLYQLTIAIVCIVVIAVWWYNCLLLPKLPYNEQHPYTSLIPIMAFIVLRNCHPLLRKNVLFLFTWCGRITLETYILQFHIWLTDDAGTILHYLPLEYPLLNFVFATTLFIGVSKLAFEFTNVISEAAIPKQCTAWQLLQRTVWAAVGWLTLYNCSKLLLLFLAAY